MKGYGQFCSFARALDLLGERWTLLVVRELLMGAVRFADVRRGIPRISKTMLALRLRELVDKGTHAPGDVAVLVRRGKAAVPIARALARVGLPALVVGGKPYRGTIRVLSDGKTLQVIDVLGLEAYVKGVVPEEMPPAWAPEALKAQFKTVVPTGS